MQTKIIDDDVKKLHNTVIHNTEREELSRTLLSLVHQRLYFLYVREHNLFQCICYVSVL